MILWNPIAMEDKAGLWICRLLGPIAFLVITSLLPHVALADWGLAGAQYSCDQKTKTFEILPYDQGSDSANDSTLGAGFKIVKTEHPKVACHLAKHTLSAVINVFPPDDGQCSGAGAVRISSVIVFGVELFPDSPLFEWACGEPVESLTRVRIVDMRHGLRVERCFTKAGALFDSAHLRCTSEDVDIDSRAAAVAARDNTLVDAATQAAQSARRLPRENDFASASDRLGADQAVPLCAHHTVFQFKSNGRIAGNSGDRIYIHPGNPQLCSAESEPLCKSKSYVIPGDRVLVGFICGDWAFIEYPHRTNASLDILGWISTDKLYAVDPLVVSPSPKELVQQRTAAHLDPLEQAAANGDVETLNQLLLAGVNPRGPNSNSEALRIAVLSQNVETVAALLKAGADSKHMSEHWNCPLIMESALFTSPSVFAALIEAGIRPACYKDGLFRLAIADYLTIIPDRINTEGLTNVTLDPVAWVTRMVAAGAPVNEARSSGKTALIAAIEPNNIEVARALLTLGANPNVVVHGEPTSTDANYGTTALIKAIVNYPAQFDPSMVQILLDGGADPNYKTVGEYYNPEGAEPGAINTLGGVTALHVAAENGYLTLTKALLEHGADPHLARFDGLLPADIARANKHPDVAAMIEKYAATK